MKRAREGEDRTLRNWVDLINLPFITMRTVNLSIST